MIYLCIPALDEAPTIGILLWKVRRVMAEFPREYEVLVLDDGSTDATSEVAGPYARVLPLVLLRNERTQGYAASVERLLREAVARSTHPKRDVAILLQADFSEAPEDLPGLIRRMEGGADVVGGTAVEAGPPHDRALRWSRKGFAWLVARAAFPREIRDPFTGFRAYRVSVLKRAFAERGDARLLTREGWAANAELLLAVAPHARRAEGAEVTVRYDRRDRESRFRAWGALKEVWHLSRRAPRRTAPAPADPAS